LQKYEKQLYDCGYKTLEHADVNWWNESKLKAELTGDKIGMSNQHYSILKQTINKIKILHWYPKNMANVLKV